MAAVNNNEASGQPQKILSEPTMARYKCPHCEDSDDNEPFTSHSKRAVQLHITNTGGMRHRGKSGSDPQFGPVRIDTEEELTLEDLEELGETKAERDVLAAALDNPHATNKLIGKMTDVSQNYVSNILRDYRSEVQHERELATLDYLEPSSDRADKQIPEVDDHVRRAILEQYEDDPDSDDDDYRRAIKRNTTEEERADFPDDFEDLGELVETTLDNYTLPPRLPSKPLTAAALTVAAHYPDKTGKELADTLRAAFPNANAQNIYTVQHGYGHEEYDSDALLDLVFDFSEDDEPNIATLREYFLEQDDERLHPLLDIEEELDTDYPEPIDRDPDDTHLCAVCGYTGTSKPSVRGHLRSHDESEKTAAKTKFGDLAIDLDDLEPEEDEADEAETEESGRIREETGSAAYEGPAEGLDHRMQHFSERPTKGMTTDERDALTEDEISDLVQNPAIAGEATESDIDDESSVTLSNAEWMRILQSSADKLPAELLWKLISQL